MALVDVPKRLLIGRAKRSESLGETLLPKRIALPVFASDALSSVAYAPQEIFTVLATAGLSFYAFSPWIGAAVVLLMLTVVTSYRQNVHAYPSGGGDYEVATVNLGPRAGLTVASALLVDYVLTVAVSVSSGVDNLASAVPFFAEHRVPLALLIVLVLTLMNLRGVRESGTAFAIPTYTFMAAVLGMIAWGLFRLFVQGDELRAPTADYTVVGHLEGSGGQLGTLAMVFLLLRAFSSGCAALTGVEAISNGVPAFQKPKSRNAATTLLMMGLVAVTMFSGILGLAKLSGAKLAEDPAEQILIDGTPAGPGYEQKTVITQVASAVFGEASVGVFFLATVTALILFLAANTAFNGFPVLGSILAQDRYLPRQLHTRGDRLAYSNGIVLLAGFAALLIWAFEANVGALIPLYTVGVFVSFTLSQTGMVRHWTRHLRSESDPAARRRMVRSRVINAVGLTFTGAVLVVVLATKFLAGAYIVVIAMPVLFLLMRAIRKHYDAVADELVAGDEAVALPARTHAIVLVSRLHKPTLRALSYARAIRPSSIEAVTVRVDPDEAAALQQEWERRQIPVPLKVLDSPYREVTRPVVDYVRSMRRDSPRDVVTVFIPEYVVGHWYEHLLHNQSALRLKGRLLFTPGVMVTSVPWQLRSSELAGAADTAERPVVGDARRGEASRPDRAEPGATDGLREPSDVLVARHGEDLR